MERSYFSNSLAFFPIVGVQCLFNVLSGSRCKKRGSYRLVLSLVLLLSLWWEFFKSSKRRLLRFLLFISHDQIEECYLVCFNGSCTFRVVQGIFFFLASWIFMRSRFLVFIYSLLPQNKGSWTLSNYFTQVSYLGVFFHTHSKIPI